VNFTTLALATAAVTLFLGFGCLFSGAFLLARWRVQPTATALLLCRRIGAAYLGLSLIFFFARSAPPSDFRTGLSAGAAITCALLAALGTFDYLSRRTGPGIFASVTVELLLAAGFTAVFLADHGLLRLVVS
jgi:hypothetical protein